MSRFFTKYVLSVCMLLAVPCLGIAQQLFFKTVTEAAIQKNGLKRVIVPTVYKTLALDTSKLKAFLKTAPLENLQNNRNTSPILYIPMPDGSVARFRIWESPTMAAELAAQFPDIKTYSGQGVDDPTATIKLDWTEAGFHAMILSSITGSIFIDPYAQGTKTFYISYFKKDFKKAAKFIELPPIRFSPSVSRTQTNQNNLSTQCIGTQLRTYRLAVACTGEYATFHGGTVSLALAAITTTVNRVNGVYEKEIAIRMILVASEANVVFASAATDPFNGNNNATILISESQSVIDTRIGTANYDMGHTFSTGGGGLSGLGIICIAGQKAQSITGSSSPVGDPYDIDYVAHEMGHALGANHTFNSTTGNCSGNGNNTTNTEPGSGTTIMAYAGICDADNLQSNSDAQFNAASLDEISTYTFFSSGTTCGTLASTGNTPPVVNAGANYIIPKSTPFVLTGSGTDANGDALTYSWEQIDIGGAFGSPTSPTGNAPLFRSFAPVSSPTRFFPRLSSVVNNTNVLGEILPTYARTLRFRLTARDNRAGGGGVCFDSTSLIVDGTAQPFVVTSPTATGIVWNVNDFKTITWDASTTAAAPIGCANVTIELSTDGGFTYPIILKASTPNDGTEQIQVPNNITSQARVRVMALGNVFYDISNNNFAIQAALTPDFSLNNPDEAFVCSQNAAATLISGSVSGFAAPITLVATNVPAGTSIVFSANPLTPGNTTTVTLNNANTLAAGSYNITITATANGGVTKMRTIAYTVPTLFAPPSALNLPANYAIGVVVLPTFSWSAVSGAASYTIELSNTPTFLVISQTFNGIATNSFTLTTPLANSTTYYWRVRTNNGCGFGGTNSNSAVFRTGFTICNASFAQDFVSTTFPPSNLTVFNPNVNNTWVRNANGNGNVGSAFIDNFNTTVLNQVDEIRTLSYSIGSVDSVIINFDVAHKYFANPNFYDTLTVLVSTDGGSNFLPTSYKKFGPGLATAGSDANAYTTPANADWRRERLSIGGNLINASSIIIAIRNTGRYGNNIFIDNIAICSSSTTPVTFTFNGNGNWSDAANWENGIIPPAILPANCAIDINPSGAGQCLLNIPSQRISTGARLTVKTGKMIVIPGSVVIQ